MAKPRKLQIALEATPYYHCTSRCVRRAFLCGFDKLSGKSFEHRRQWIEDRILLLGSVFCIDVCAYAVMSNHLHVVLHINKQESDELSNLDVCLKWHTLFKGTLLTHKYVKGEALTQAEIDAAEEKITLWRSQLCSISWFMRSLNEPIARLANAEDQCTGKFWEARFSSQALLDEAALAACMAYVDLNPIRAKMATTPETSTHTSIKKRIEYFAEKKEQPRQLAAFIGNPRENMPHGLPFHLKDYIELVDWTGRIIREDKRGAIANNLPPILSRLNIAPKQWLMLTTRFESKFKSIVGRAETIKQKIKSLGYIKKPPIQSSVLHST